VLTNLLSIAIQYNYKSLDSLVSEIDSSNANAISFLGMTNIVTLATYYNNNLLANSPMQCGI